MFRAVVNRTAAKVVNLVSPVAGIHHQLPPSDVYLPYILLRFRIYVFPILTKMFQPFSLSPQIIENQSKSG